MHKNKLLMNSPIYSKAGLARGSQLKGKRLLCCFLGGKKLSKMYCTCINTNCMCYQRQGLAEKNCDKSQFVCCDMLSDLIPVQLTGSVCIFVEDRFCRISKWKEWISRMTFRLSVLCFPAKLQASATDRKYKLIATLSSFEYTCVCYSAVCNVHNVCHVFHAIYCQADSVVFIVQNYGFVPVYFAGSYFATLLFYFVNNNGLYCIYLNVVNCIIPLVFLSQITLIRFCLITNRQCVT